MKSDFSTVLSALRRERGISQKKAAVDLEISQALLSHYENGVREPKFEFVDRVCAYYGVSADYILGRQQTDSVIVPCESGCSGEIAEATLEIVELVEALDNEDAKKAVAEYISFTAERMKNIADSAEKTESPETVTLERLYMCSVYRAIRNESTENIEDAISKLRELN